MGVTEAINYPPDEIIQPPKVKRKNFEHIILWMLTNNKECEWANFISDPLNISQSTLSMKLDSLRKRGFLQKISKEVRGRKKNIYIITSEGKERYYELSTAIKQKRKLNYPPDAILRKRNYDHWILWMEYNNNYLKWSDFLNVPLSINQSALSKNLNDLQQNLLIRKENKEYRITRAGKSEYSRMLRLYDLDRQSILNEESKRIAEITKHTIEFFENYKIKNDDIKFRFLNNVLKFSFDKMKGSLDSEEDFNKILLFLSMNHPNQYPEYISTEEFSRTYNIDKIDLEFNIRRIVEKNIFSIKFFKLEAHPGNMYYFQENEKIEKILRAITEDHITKFTYLNKLYENTIDGASTLTLNSTIDAILNEICINLFKLGLKDTLKEFIQEYIKNLAYRMESEKILVDTLDKLEGIAWRNIPEVFQAYSAKYDLVEQAQFKYSINFNILKVLKFFSTPKIAEMFEVAKHSMKSKNYDDALNDVNKSIESEPENVELMFLKALILSVSNRHNEAIIYLKEVVRSFFTKKDEDYALSYYFIMIYCYMTLDRFDKALKFGNKVAREYPDHPLSFVARALIFGYKIIYQLDLEDVRTDQVLDDIDKAILLEPIDSNKSKYYHFKSSVLKQLKKYDDALDAIGLAIEFDPKDINLRFMKYHILYHYEKIDEAIEIVKQDIGEFPEKEIKLLTHLAYLYKKKNNLDEGIKLIDELRVKYPENHEILNNKIYWHLYRGEKEEALKAGNQLIELNPNDGNFHDSYAEALTEFGEYEEALKASDKALELEPLGWFTYNTYLQRAKCYKEIGKYDLARESLEKGGRATQTCFCGIEMREEWKVKKEEVIAEIEDLEAKS